jgi:carbonic anhydrase
VVNSKTLLILVAVQHQCDSQVTDVEKGACAMAANQVFSRREFLQSSAVALGATGLVAPFRVARAQEADLITDNEAIRTPDEALARLLEGNARYMSNQSIPLDESPERRTAVASGQQPIATIFSCVDSRVPPELVFDQGLGDLFVIRTAAHVIDKAVLGSLEFGVAELKIPLLVVMGHAKCGAVKATIETLEASATAPADIDYLVDSIQLAVENVAGQEGDRLDNAVREHTKLVTEQLKTSAILVDALAAGSLKIVGARYDLDTGGVEVIA